jgi:hypothetical protein
VIALEPHLLARRTRRPVVLAAAVASAVLCPLVDELVLGGVFRSGAYSLLELAVASGWAALLGAALGALVVERSLQRERGAGHTVGFAAIAGALHPVPLIGGAALTEIRDLTLDALGRVLVAPFILLLIGSIVSVPAGLVFGAVFASGVAPAHGALVSPSHESPAIA